MELPYLQLALIKLWEAEGGAAASILRERTLTDQTKLGGVEQIVRVHVKTVMDHLTIDEQALCAKIFDRLVTSIGSKVAYPTEALASPEVAGRGVGRFALEETLGKLTPKEARVLKPVVTGGAPGFEIFHDVLGVPILEWTRSFKVEAQRRKDRETRRSISILALGGAISSITISRVSASAPLPTAPGGTRPDWTSVVGRGAQLVVRSQPKPEIKLRSGPRLNSLSHDQDDWSYWSRQ